MTEIVSLSAVQDLYGSRLTAVAFNQIAVREGLVHLRRATFPAAELTLEQLSVLGDVELAERLPAGASVVLRLGPRMVACLWAGRGNGEIAVAGTERDGVDRVASDLIAALRDPEPRDDHVPITFWAHSQGRPLNPRRRIQAPAWHEIRPNYGQAARGELDELMRSTGPGPGGLLLWHGEPGTGKSHALRALARAWRGWCDTHFITDADAFLGGQTSYMLNALQHSDDGAAGDERWRLIVLEDAGELLAADARAVAGQALSRLLNLSDGVLGAGLRAIVLVTTNEPLRRLHPAVVRPGRTWAEIEFPALTADEANAWLAARGGGARVDRVTPLAEAFALLGGRRAVRQPGVGFAAA
ncbi:MAG: DUF5925 domain-containing protein [Actinomycetota bacterium]|nr:DUF5925 domain-containing protein [Actinomycetota bacterium]